MDPIYLVADLSFSINGEQLRTEFNKIIELKQDERQFSNTISSLSWIMRGGIEYFDTLKPDFLGKGNASGIPNMKADHFVNNFYRLSNTLEYLGRLWKIKFEESKEWKLLKDIRTIIVHSGEQISNIQSIELRDYKDAQLGRIFNRDDVIMKISDRRDFDYQIQIWTDKHDTSKRRPKNEVDYDSRNQNFREIDIYLNAKDIRFIILSHIEKFIDLVKGRATRTKPLEKLPEAVKQQVTNEIDFNKLEKLISNKERGDYLIESESRFWYGFGLKKLWDYISGRIEISERVRNEIRKAIQERLNDFWNSYNDEAINDENLPSLDVKDVFKKYTPKYELKSYLEGEKLFINIAPTFNVKDRIDLTEVDYLFKFIIAANTALGVDLDLENTVNGVICDYFVKSVEVKLKEERRNY